MAHKPSIWKRISSVFSSPKLVRNGRRLDQHTYSAKSLKVYYGIRQSESTQAARLLDIKNVGSAKNPRYYNADAKRIIRHFNR